MTPWTAISSLDRALAATGESVTLQRTAIDSSTGALTVSEEVTCPAQIRAYAPQDLAAGEVQDIRVILSPSGLGTFGVPGKDDRIVINGNPSNIEQIGPIYYGGQLVRINLLCRG
jgi:hypothetical protein